MVVGVVVAKALLMAEKQEVRQTEPVHFWNEMQRQYRFYGAIESVFYEESEYSTL